MEYHVLVKLILLIFGIQIVHGMINSSSRITPQQRLMKKLFTDPEYDPRARPVTDFGEPVTVTVRLNFYQLIEVDERGQFVPLYAWNTQMWKSNTLTWDPRDYDNLTSLVVPYEEIWIPDTYLYNSLKMSRRESERWVSAILEVDLPENVSHENTHARVIFRYPALYKFMCNMDVRYFPFDTQHCRMIFGSWTFDATGIVFIPENRTVAREDYQENEEWTVLNLTSSDHMENYTCCPNPFSFIHVDMVLRRRPLHYLVNLFVPILIVSAIGNIGYFSSSTTYAVREQKIGLGMGTLVALSLILMMVADQMPTTSTSVPLVGQFFVAVMVQTALGALATTGILLVHQRGVYGYSVPAWVKRIMFQIVAPRLGVERRRIIMPNFESYDFQWTPPRGYRDWDVTPTLRRSFKLENLAQLHDEVAELQFLLGRKYHKSLYRCERDLDKLDWEFLASILDRIFLLISLFIVIMLCALFIFFGFIQ